jgi:hypothetical protein
MHKASSYPAISRDNHHLQIECYQAHAISSCVEMLTWEVDVCIVKVRYLIPIRERSQRVGAGDLIAERINTDIAALSVRAWSMYFDGSACGDGCGIGILLVSPRGKCILFQSDYLPLAPIIWWNMKRCVRVWSCFLRPELKQWKFFRIQNW